MLLVPTVLALELLKVQASEASRWDMAFPINIIQQLALEAACLHLVVVEVLSTHTSSLAW